MSKMAIPTKRICKNGHDKLLEGMNKHSHCLKCKREIWNGRKKRKKKMEPIYAKREAKRKEEDERYRRLRAEAEEFEKKMACILVGAHHHKYCPDHEACCANNDLGFLASLEIGGRRYDVCVQGCIRGWGVFGGRIKVAVDIAANILRCSIMSKDAVFWLLRKRLSFRDHRSISVNDLTSISRKGRYYLGRDVLSMLDLRAVRHSKCDVCTKKKTLWRWTKQRDEIADYFDSALFIAMKNKWNFLWLGDLCYEPVEMDIHALNEGSFTLGFHYGRTTDLFSQDVQVCSLECFMKAHGSVKKSAYEWRSKREEDFKCLKEAKNQIMETIRYLRSPSEQGALKLRELV